MNVTDIPAAPTAPDFSKMLDGWLTEWYEASVLGRGTPDDTILRFNRIATISPQLRGEAVRRLNVIKDIPAERCFITKTQADFLRKVTA